MYDIQQITCVYLLNLAYHTHTHHKIILLRSLGIKTSQRRTAPVNKAQTTTRCRTSPPAVSATTTGVMLEWINTSHRCEDPKRIRGIVLVHDSHVRFSHFNPCHVQLQLRGCCISVVSTGVILTQGLSLRPICWTEHAKKQAWCPMKRQ